MTTAENARREYNLELTKLRDQAAGSAPLGARRTVEQKYGAAYQKLVRLGVMPQLRGKYRGR